MTQRTMTQTWSPDNAFHVGRLWFLCKSLRVGRFGGAVQLARALGSIKVQTKASFIGVTHVDASEGVCYSEILVLWIAESNAMLWFLFCTLLISSKCSLAFPELTGKYQLDDDGRLVFAHRLRMKEYVELKIFYLQVYFNLLHLVIELSALI